MATEAGVGGLVCLRILGGGGGDLVMVLLVVAACDLEWLRIRKIRLCHTALTSSSKHLFPPNNTNSYLCHESRSRSSVGR